MERPDWDETWLTCAHTMSKRSRCYRAQVGAVIVADDQTVVSMSYNGPPRDYPTSDADCRDWCPRAQTNTPSPTYDDCVSVHAEANAIARADFSRMQGSTIYVSTSCCKACAKMLANAGVQRVVFKHEDDRDYRNPEETVRFLRKCGIEVSVV
jgi:dCMP deaminase